MRPEVFAHFQLHPSQFGQEATGGLTVVVEIGFGLAQLLDLPLEPLDALQRGPVFLFDLNHVGTRLVRPRARRYVAAMSYTTLEVEIEHGRIVPREPRMLPENGSGLVAILNAFTSAEPRPLGLAKGEFTVPDDFNQPLPDDVLRGFEGK